ncbi:MAG: hypothetical protein R3E89_15030 [Thiolinea sp.]
MPFGERLVKLGKLKPADLERALRAQAEIHQPLGSVLVRLGMLTEQEVGSARAIWACPWR